MLSEAFYTICPVESVSHLAAHKGFFKETFDAIGVKFGHISTLPKEEWNNHFTHSHPFFFRDGGNIPPIWTRARGTDTVAIGATFAQRKQVVMVRKESPINNVTDLRGMKLALPIRTGAYIDFWKATIHRGAWASLKAHGLTEKDVELVDTPLSEEYLAADSCGDSIWSHKTDFKSFIQGEFAALEDGRVDAVYSEGARVGAIERMDQFRTIYVLSSHPDLFYKVNICSPCVITASGRLAREYPEIVDAYMAAVIKACRWAEHNRDEAIDIFSRELYVDHEAVERSFPKDFHKHLMPKLDQDAVDALRYEKDFLRDNGYIQADFDITQWIDRRFLERAVDQYEQD